MERCLPVGRVGEDGSSIRVLDHEKKTKRHKKGNNPISTFLPFKTKKMVRMERCLLVERVGKNGSSIGVLDSKIGVKEQEGAKWGLERKKKGERMKWGRRVVRRK